MKFNRKSQDQIFPVNFKFTQNYKDKMYVKDQKMYFQI